MEIIKKRLGDLDRSYCASYLKTKEGNKIILASEAYVDEGRPCYSYFGENFEKSEIVWPNSGGCMSFVQIPHRENEFIAIQDFYLKESPSRSKLVWGIYENGKWEIHEILHLPYLHRFTVAEVDGELYLVCATIADSKTCKEDWSKPGSIYVAKLPENYKGKIELKKIKTDIFKNHGFSYDTRTGHNEIYFGTEQGLFKLYLKGKPEDWKFEQLLDNPVGEIAVGDLDGDGIDEFITIEPFHGNIIRIYKSIDGKYKQVYEYPNKIDFAHALIYTTFRGVPTFVCGVRKEEAELFYIQYKDGKYVPTIIEKGVGPANVDCINYDDKDILISANHSKNEAAIYVIK